MIASGSCSNCFSWILGTVFSVVLLILVLFSAVEYRDSGLSQKAKINRLEMKIESLENVCRWEKVLTPILSSIQKEELDLLEEQIKQEIEAKFAE